MRLPTYEEALSTALRTAADGEPIVGGLALTIWAAALQIDQARDFGDTATRDLDFVAPRTFARNYERNLRGAGLQVKGAYADVSRDAGSPNVAVFTIPVEDDPEPFTIDILSTVSGLATADIRNRSQVLLYNDHPVRVMHTCDLAVSRAYNILLLPERRSERDFAQLALAVAILRVWMARRARGTSGAARRDVLDVADRLNDFSRHRDGMAAYLDYGIDLMGAIPVEAMPQAYQRDGHPRVVGDLEARRARRVADRARRDAERAAAAKRRPR